MTQNTYYVNKLIPPLLQAFMQPIVNGRAQIITKLWQIY